MLRMMGGFKGRIVVYTDTPIPFKKAEVRRVEQFLPTDKRRAVAPYWARLLVWDDLITDSSDQYLYIDSDIICVKDISPILEPSLFPRFFKQSRGTICTLGDRTMRELLTPEELEQYSNKPGVNSGLYLVRREHTKYLALWRDYYRDGMPDMDQPSLNALVLRGAFPIDVYPDDWMWFYQEKGEPQDMTILEHYVIRKVKFRERYYQILRERRNIDRR